LAAIMKLGVIYIFSHDSIGLGEDGPTHQPVEQIMGLRMIPDLVLIRPADAAEAVEAWQPQAADCRPRLRFGRPATPTQPPGDRTDLPAPQEPAPSAAAGRAQAASLSTPLENRTSLCLAAKLPSPGHSLRMVSGNVSRLSAKGHGADGQDAGPAEIGFDHDLAGEQGQDQRALDQDAGILGDRVQV
jgi:transketolase